MQQIEQIIDKFNYPKQYSKELYAKTKKYQKQYGFALGKCEHDTWNNEADAFKHTFGAAEISIKRGEPVSKAITDYHEFHQKNNPTHEENMDKWNNYEGRKIAEDIRKNYSQEEIKEMIKTGEIDDVIAEKVMQKMKRGDLITDPFNDKRKFDEKSIKDKIFDLKNRVFHQNEITIKDLDNPDLKKAYLDQALGRLLPTKKELDKKVASGGLVHVSNYERSDGTKVSGYYRAYPS